jgi:hypothetical protein
MNGNTGDPLVGGQSYPTSGVTPFRVDALPDDGYSLKVGAQSVWYFVNPSGATVITPAPPTFDGTTITVPDDNDLVYYSNAITGNSYDNQTVPVPSGETVYIQAIPRAGTSFTPGAPVYWSFKNNS